MRVHCARQARPGLLILALGAASTMFATTAMADFENLSFYCEAPGFADFMTADTQYIDEEGFVHSEKDTYYGADEIWSMSWSVVSYDGVEGLTTDPNGPMVDAELVVTNNSNTTQTFTIMVTNDIAMDYTSDVYMSGGVGATVTNNDPFGGMAELNNSQDGTGADIPVYQGLIDNGSARDMWDSGYSLQAVGGAASNADSDSFNREIATGGVDTIGVMLTIKLSAGDSATVSGLFQISKVPAPGALALIGLAGLAGRRRRRC